MTGPQGPYRDDAARRVGEALQAQARGRPVPPRPGSAAPPRVPGRLPPPAPRPAPPQQRPAPPASPTRQVVWAAVIALLVGALLGGGIALISVLVPGALPALG